MSAKKVQREKQGGPTLELLSHAPVRMKRNSGAIKCTIKNRDCSVFIFRRLMQSIYYISVLFEYQLYDKLYIKFIYNYTLIASVYTYYDENFIL